jgi:choline dehydrogenase-like flavoprotein
VYATPGGETHRQAARRFVVAAGGVETPRLLFLSRSATYPDGLANSSGTVGRYFMDHLFAGMGGRLDADTRQHHVGFNTSESHQFYDDTEPVNGLKLEFLNYAGPTVVGAALTAETWGDELRAQLAETYGTHVGMGALVEQLPRRENRVTLDPSTTDDHGNPVPDLQWSWGDRVVRSIDRANEIQHAVLGELGADIAWTANAEGGTGPAYHHMGTTRMGTDPSESVVNPQLRTHDLSNLSIASSSVFVTAGSMNPTLTIAALALKCADHVDERL